MENVANTQNDSKSNIEDALEAFETFKQLTARDYTESLNLFDEHSTNSHDIDRLKVRNEDILVEIMTNFQSKLKEFKKVHSKKEAINATFNLLQMEIEAENTHKATLQAFKQFKAYYTSKLYIPSSVISLKNIKTALKLEKYIPIKVINSALNHSLDETVKAELEPLEITIKNIQIIIKCDRFTDLQLNDLASITNHYIISSNGKIKVDKSNYNDIDIETLNDIAKEIVISGIQNRPISLKGLIEVDKGLDKEG